MLIFALGKLIIEQIYKNLGKFEMKQHFVIVLLEIQTVLCTFMLMAQGQLFLHQIIDYNGRQRIR